MLTVRAGMGAMKAEAPARQAARRATHFILVGWRAVWMGGWVDGWMD